MGVWRFISPGWDERVGEGCLVVFLPYFVEPRVYSKFQFVFELRERLGVNQVGFGVEVVDEAVSRLKKDGLLPQVGIGFEVVVLVEESLACHIVGDLVVPD